MNKFRGGVSKSRSFVNAILTFLCAAVFFCGFFATKNTLKTEAYNSSNTPNNNIGEITLSGYESRKDGLVFDYDQLEILYGKIVEAATGTVTATANIKMAHDSVFAKSSTVTGTASTGNDLTQYQSLDFKTMTTNLSDKKPITLKFGGIDWTVVYATTNTTTGGTTQAGDLVVTLWANDITANTTSKWSAATPSNDVASGDYPTNMYSSSYIRVNTLNAGGDDGVYAQTGVSSPTTGSTYYATDINIRSSAGEVLFNNRIKNQFAKFTLSNNVLTAANISAASAGSTTKANSSLTSFLTQPKNMEYQRAENWVWSYGGTGMPYLCPNEAWGIGSDGPDLSLKHTGTNKTGGWNPGTANGVNQTSMPNKPAYTEWSNDYLWLPSLTETGFYNAKDTCGVSLWGIPAGNDIWKSTAPTGSGVTDISWLRTGDLTWGNTTFGLASAGSWVYNRPSVVGGIRPALHLNLSQADLSAAGVPIEEPTDKKFSLDYNGDDQGLSSLDWYQSDVFDDSDWCSVTYYNDKNKKVTPKDEGTYRVVIEFTGDRYYWKDTPAGDNDKKREFELTIKPKELRVKFEVDDTTGMPTYEFIDDPYDGDTVNAEIHYYDTDGNHIGTDTSQLRGKTDYEAELRFDKDNYVPKFVPSLDGDRLEFTNPATRVKASWMSASPEYTGSAQRFILLLSGGTATATLKEDYGEDVKQTAATQFSAVNAGKYTVVLSLANKDDYVWDDTGESDDYEFDFEIKPKTVTLNIASLANEVTEGYTTSAQIELLPITSGTLRVILTAYYQNNFIDNLCAIDLSTANTHSESFTLETGNLLSPFTYDLQIDYDDPDDLNAKNHKIVLDTSYSITVKEPSLAGGLNWRLTSGGSVVGNKADPADTNSTTYTDKITYSGKSYSFTVNAAGIGYSVDTAYNDNDFTSGYKTVKKGTTTALSTVTNAGTYVTTVHLTNGTDTAEYSIEWTIDKAKFDLSGVRWLPKDGEIEYSDDMSIAIDPDTLPEGLSVKEYDGSYSVSSVGQNGQAIVIFKVADSDNYVLPVSTDSTTYIFKAHDGLDDFEWTKDWEVVPAEIPVVWTVGTVTASGNKKVNAKMLDGGYDAYLDYVYYESDSRGNVADGATPVSELSVIEGTVKYYVAEVSVKTNFANQYKLETGKSNRSGVFEVGHTLTAVQLAAKKTEYTYWGQPVEFKFKVTQGTVTEEAFDITYYKGTLRQVNPPKDVGTYTARISLKNNYTNKYYIDGDYSFEYEIVRAVIKIDWNTNTKPSSLKLTAEEKACVSYEYCDSTGNTVNLNTIRMTPGTYNVRAVIKSASAKNYIFNNSSTMTDWQQFTVASGDLITDPETAAPSNPTVDPNEANMVRFSLASATGAAGTAPQVQNSAGLTKDVDYVIAYFKDGQPVSDFSAAGTYEIRVTLIGSAASQYRLESGSDTLMYAIMEGSGDGTTTNPNDGEGENPSDATIISYLPLILSGVSLVLIIVFLIMTLNNLSAAKEAKAKTKKLATMSYSFAPAGLLAMVFGLSEGNWWIIAGVLMGLALLMAIAAFMSKSKKKKALAALEEEQERIAEEKEYARQEEQQRRDNEMKMMFAAMQQQGGGGYAQPMYDDSHIQNLIASTVSALLPTIQQQMALPPAQSDPSVYAMPNPEVDALRAQLAEQQELLKQVLQNQQSQQYEPYEEEIVDDTSWLGESDEVVSLEESYGALSDEGKRAYYEIGSYIMNKPRTSQNDGRYAVLFKYRGRTIFKLCIKENAPVLYYPSGSGRAEVRVVDGSSLEVAKGMIDRTVAKVDSELN